jgi:hypothetical protein
MTEPSTLTVLLNFFSMIYDFLILLVVSVIAVLGISYYLYFIYHLSKAGINNNNNQQDTKNN